MLIACNGPGVSSLVCPHCPSSLVLPMLVFGRCLIVIQTPLLYALQISSHQWQMQMWPWLKPTSVIRVSLCVCWRYHTLLPNGSAVVILATNTLLRISWPYPPSVETMRRQKKTKVKFWLNSGRLQLQSGNFNFPGKWGGREATLEVSIFHFWLRTRKSWKSCSLQQVTSTADRRRFA